MYITKTIDELRKDLDDKKVTSEELVKESLELAHKYQDEYNSFVTICDEASGTESQSILSGIPCAIKDNISTKGVLTTASSNILKNYVPFYDATVVEKLKAAGAVSIGKTVLDELAMGGTGTTGHTGAVKNPWDKNRLIGGSSAGSASSVALGIVPFALGSDTGDSIRKPAAYGGIVGYKPTYGLVSRFGLFPFACSLDHVGCFTRSVKDVAYVIDCIKGKDQRDMTSLNSADMDLTSGLTTDIKGKKLFYFAEMLDRKTYADDYDDELEAIISNFEKIIEDYKKLGASVEAVSFDTKLLEAIFPTYFTISCAEATSNNSNLTGIILGPRGDGDSIEKIMFDARSKGFSELIKRRFVFGSFVLQKENQEKLFLNSQRIRRLIVDKMTELFKEYDGLILPAQGSVAPKFRSETVDKLSSRYLMLENHLAIGNFGGFPSITIPCGFVNDMPIGLSITGGIKKDLDVLNIAYALESIYPYKGQIAKEVK